MSIYIIPGDELGSLATVINTKKVRFGPIRWNLFCLMNAQEQQQNYVDCSKTDYQFPDQLFCFCFNIIFANSIVTLLMPPPIPLRICYTREAGKFKLGMMIDMLYINASIQSLTPDTLI